MNTNKCIICSSKQFQYKFEIDKYKIYQCEICKLAFIEPKPQKERLLYIYEKVYYEDKVDMFDTDIISYDFVDTAQWLEAKLRLRLIKRFIHNGSLLDIGCGQGLFVKVASKGNFDSYGLDISKTAVQFARTLNDREKIIHSEFKEGLFEKNRFDVITLWDTLEHLPRPDLIFRECYNILKKEGYMFITTGNICSFFARICGRGWHLLNIPEHLFFFSPTAIFYLAKKHRFKPRLNSYKIHFYSLSYILKRLKDRYNIKLLKPTNISLFRAIPLPLNLFDIMTVVLQKL